MEGYLWVDRILIFVLSPILVLAVVGAIASRQWIGIPVVAAFALILYGIRRLAVWIGANSAKARFTVTDVGRSTSPAPVFKNVT